MSGPRSRAGRPAAQHLVLQRAASGAARSRTARPDVADQGHESLGGADVRSLARVAPAGHVADGRRRLRVASPDSGGRLVRLRIRRHSGRHALVSLARRRAIRQRPVRSARDRRARSAGPLRSRGNPGDRRLVPATRRGDSSRTRRPAAQPSHGGHEGARHGGGRDERSRYENRRNEGARHERCRDERRSYGRPRYERYGRQARHRRCALRVGPHERAGPLRRHPRSADQPATSNRAKLCGCGLSTHRAPTNFASRSTAIPSPSSPRMVRPSRRSRSTIWSSARASATTRSSLPISPVLRGFVRPP